MTQDLTLSRRQILRGQMAPPSSPETHICSLVVHCRPDREAGIRAAIAALPGAEIHSSGAKLVVTLETASDAEVVERMNGISLLDGVLSAALVYHHVEPEAAGV